ncbi:MAG TPA: hypothetical protein PLZ61_07855, partial [Candidatus Cryosericum sp.]|nr:hypothetical protein [Candidatus Cryosericum sp.]
WHYTGTGDTPDASGFEVKKTYCAPGTRSVRLLCQDAAIWLDDEDTATGVGVTIPLTLEIDTMTGDHSIPTGNLPAAWERVGYQLEIDPDQESIECFEYMTVQYPLIFQQQAFFREHENQGCHLYLMGIHRWSPYDPDNENSDPCGNTLNWTWNAVCACTSRGIAEAQREEVALHENGAHDATIGNIGHCALNDQGCNANEHMNGSLPFCSNSADPSSNQYCLHELKHYLESHLDE